MEEVAGIDLVDRREQEIGGRRQVRELLGLGPGRIRRRDVVEARQLLGLERAGRVEERGVPALERRRLADQRELVGRDRDDLIVEDELARRGGLLGGEGEHGGGRRAIGGHRGDDLSGRVFRIDRARGLVERGEVAAEVGLGDRGEPAEIDLDALRLGEHAQELLGAEGERLGAGRLLLGEPCRVLGQCGLAAIERRIDLRLVRERDRDRRERGADVLVDELEVTLGLE